MVERLSCKQDVAGSSPAAGTIEIPGQRLIASDLFLFAYYPRTIRVLWNLKSALKIRGLASPI